MSRSANQSPNSTEANKNLKEHFSKNSFKIKAILLELPNYEYFHSSIKGKGKQSKDRFVGRVGIINRLLSFMHETSVNTGTYLVTGFRGMGKTSLVNKALSGLNPKQNASSFFLLWFTLLPFVIFFEEIHSFFLLKNYTYILWTTLVTFLFFSVFTILFLGVFNNRMNRVGQDYDFRKDFYCFKSGFETLLNPNLSNSKYTVVRNLRFLWIYISCILILMFAGIFYSKFENIFLEHLLFWLVSYSLLFSYLSLDIYKAHTLLIKKNKKSKLSKIGNEWVRVLILILVFLSFQTLFFFSVSYEDTEIRHGFNWETISFILLNFILLFTYFIYKIKLWQRLKKLNDQSKKMYSSFLVRFMGFFNFQQFIVVKVNLGKDSLTEKDVLKYITNELYKEYSHWFSNFKNAKRFLNTLGLLTLMYLTFTAVYIGFLGSEFNKFSSKSMKIPIYFPSQAILTLDRKISLKEVDKLFIVTEQDSLDMDFPPKEKVSIGDAATLEQYIYKIRRLDSVGNTKIGYSTYERTKGENGYTLMSNVSYGLIVISNELDYLALKLWIKVKKVLLSDHFDDESAVAPLVNMMYPNVPILFVYFLMIFFIISLRIVPRQILPFRTHFDALRELKSIKKQIDASVTFEEGTNGAAIQTSWFNFKKKVSYKPLEAKEITQKLIHLLDTVHSLKFIFTRVKFIFVFDELDKINPHNTVVLSTKEDEFSAENNEVRYQARRKERIALILASMKHFLNSAKAKFIFIAGREMYDAALAGISDRESSLDSIFNDNKIYVNSFYTEEHVGNTNDITSVTEQYLCQFLIPESFLTRQNELPSLTVYNEYLIDYFNGKQKEKREKIISVLKDYIVYLSYRSNGAPRKLSNLIEQNVIPVRLKELQNTESILVGHNNNNLYINIGYYDQYKFSLISSLTTPVFFSIGSFLHEYSDKLLVSISYMLDHLYKFHKFGISYRSLSLTPEIVDVNKEPQFREFLDKLVASLSKNHLRPIVSGIYDFKFHSKIISEIKFLSKIDDLEGAALNFTLDESIELKRYFNRRLEQFREKSHSVIVKSEGVYTEDHINNIGLHHMMIGDLHFYDEEYQDAISHYMESVQKLRQRDYRKMFLYDFILFIRNKLKLALAFEKNKMYDNAFMTYSELSDLIIRKTSIPLRKFGLARFVLSGNDIDTSKGKLKCGVGNHVSNKAHLEKVVLEKWKANKNMRDFVVIGRLKSNIIKKMDSGEDDKNHSWKKLFSIEDMEVFYDDDSQDLIKEIDEIDVNYKPLKHYFPQSTGENIRLLYQPLIAKLHIIEKSSPDKLKDIDIVRAIKEFNFLKRPLKTKKKRVIVSEFYNKIGDLLYFKNGTLNKELKERILNEIDLAEEKSEKDALKNLLISPIDAALFYLKSLAVLLIPNHKKSDSIHSRMDLIDYYSNIELGREKNNGESVFKIFDETYDEVIIQIDKITKEDNQSFKERYSYEYLTSVANGIVDLAETLSSFVEGSYTQKKLRVKWIGFESKILDFKVKFDRVLRLYYSAYIIYQGVGAYRLAKSQLLKVLHVLRETSIHDVNLFVEEITRDSLVKKAISCIYYTYDLGHLIEGRKISEIMKGDEINDNMQKSTIIAEINEVILLLWRLEVNELKEKEKRQKKVIEKIKESILTNEKLDKNRIVNEILKNKKIKNTELIELNIEKELVEYYKKIKKNIGPFSCIRRKHNRMIQLRLLLKVNILIFERYFLDSEFTERNNIPQEFLNSSGDKIELLSPDEFKNFLIIDSIGANNELLKSHYLFGVDYVTTNHNQLAKAHYTMGVWCERYKQIQNDDLDKILKDQVLNTKTLMSLSADYHFNQSLEYNYKTRNFHTRGEPLNAFLKTASYLDDFFNDSLIHFSISVERNTVHEKEVGGDYYIQEIRNKASEKGRYDIFDYNNYIK